MRGREVVDRLSQKTPLPHDDPALSEAAVADMDWRSEKFRFTGPPSTCADDIGTVLDFTEDVEHIMAGYWGVSVVGVLLSLNGKHQVAVLNICESAVVSGVVRKNSHAGSQRPC